MACPRSYPSPRLPRISYLGNKPTSLSASTCFPSLTSLPRSLTALGRSLGVLHPVSATAPLCFWRRTRLQRAAKANSKTSSWHTKTPSSASRSIASSVCHHPASSPIYAPQLLVLFPISVFKLCGVNSSWRVSTYWMTRGLQYLVATWLDAAEMLRSTPLTLGWRSSLRFVAQSLLVPRFSRTLRP
jgi:hypothetical protein